MVRVLVESPRRIPEGITYNYHSRAASTIEVFGPGSGMEGAARTLLGLTIFSSIYMQSIIYYQSSLCCRFWPGFAGSIKHLHTALSAGIET
jgi:hypothetical protein